MRFEQIPAAQIRRNPNQPRQFFDENGLQELADSIRENGLLQPVTVRATLVDFEIIAGERRTRACAIAGVDPVPCMVLDDVDDERAFILATLENVARKDMKPIEEAKAYAQIVAMGKTPEEVGQMVGKATFAVTWRLELLKLAPEFQDVELPMNVARLMSRVSIDGQRAIWHRYIGGEFKSVQECERFCNVVIAKEAQVDLFAPAQVDGFGQDELRRERARATRNTIATAWAKLAQLTQAFCPISEASLQDVADALDGDIDSYLAQARALEAGMRKARIALENAKALQKVSA